MGESLEARDNEAVTRAIELLRDAGYRVPAANNTQTSHDGVTFQLEIEAPTKYAGWDEGGGLGGGDDA